LPRFGIFQKQGRVE